MDKILKGTCIYDGVGKEPFEGYLVIRGDTIAQVGRGEVPPSFVGDHYEWIDCGEGTVLPGFCDSHVHFLFGALELSSVNLFPSKSQEEAAQMLYDHWKYKEEPWVIAFGWSQYEWKDTGLPEKETLDRVFPSRPVIAFNDELHGAWVNSKALALCGITGSTMDPKGGRIWRNERGEPSGFLLEQSAMELITKKAFCFSEERENELAKLFLQKAHRMGVTSIADVQVLGLCAYKICERLERKGQLSLRVFFSPPIDLELEELGRLKGAYHSDRLAFLGAKGFVDGTPLGHTGLLLEPYSDRDGDRGHPVIDLEWLRQRTQKLDSMGIPVRLHACGDGAVREALDAIEFARKSNGFNGVRHTIEHIENIHEEDLQRFQQLGGIASIQPSHMVTSSLKTHPIFSILGEERCKLAWPGKSLQSKGALVAFGTDFPIVDFDPIDTLYRAVNRVMGDHLPMGGWNPKEKFSVAEALKHYTADGAYLMNREHKIGTIEQGKLADIAVLSHNIFEIDPMELSRVFNTLTVFNGEICYRK